MTHPSIQGLREAVEGAIKSCVCQPYDATGGPQGPLQECPRHGDWRATAEAALIAQAAYLTEHGVLLSGEGLVRSPERDGRSVVPRDVPGLDKLYERARREPIEVDLSDWSDEYVAGFLAGQAQVVAMLPEPLTFLVPVPQDGE